MVKMSRKMQKKITSEVLIKNGHFLSRKNRRTKESEEKRRRVKRKKNWEIKQEQRKQRKIK